MRFTMYTTCYRSRKRANKKGHAPIKIRITVNGIREEISTGILVQEQQWCRESQSVIKHPQAQVYNVKIQQIKTELYAVHLDMEMKHLPVTAFNVMSAYKARFRKQFYLVDHILAEYMNELHDNKKTKKETKRIYRIRAVLFKQYLVRVSKKPLPIACIDTNIVDRYLTLLYNKYSLNYASKALVFLRSFLNWCVRRQYIDRNPMFGVRLKWKKPRKIFLDKRELALLAGYKFVSGRLQEVADIFLFQCYSGLSYCDTVGFTKSEIQHGFIIDERQKIEDSKYIIPVTPELTEMLNKYNGVMPKISLTNYNSYLKEIAGITGIDKNLTTHVGRKTCGRFFLDKGLSMEVVSRILGHDDIKITQRVYCSVGTDRIQKELDSCAA